MSPITISQGSIPTLFVKANCLPEAWEKAVLTVWEHGIDVKTEYDKPEDPASKDATVMIEVEDPFAEPRATGAARQQVIGSHAVAVPPPPGQAPGKPDHGFTVR